MFSLGILRSVRGQGSLYRGGVWTELANAKGVTSENRDLNFARVSVEFARPVGQGQLQSVWVVAAVLRDSGSGFPTLKTYTVLGEAAGKNGGVTTVLVVSSRQTVLRLIGGKLQGSKRFIATCASTTRMPLSGLGECSLVVLSVVVPSMSNFSCYSGVHSLMSYPVLFLATGAVRRSVAFKLNLKTSSCLAGPFHVTRLQTEMGTRLQHRHERQRATVAFSHVGVSLSTGRLQMSGAPITLAGDRCLVYRCLTEGGKRMFSGRRVCRTIFDLRNSDSGSAVSARVGGVQSGLGGLSVRPVTAI